MKAISAAIGAILILTGAASSAYAQPYGGYDRGGRDRDYGERDRDYRGGGRDRDRGFDEREYLRCHPDVRRAVMRGEMESGFDHYRRHGRREGRRLSC